MNPNIQVFFDNSAAVRTFLASPIWVNLAIVNISLPAHPREDLIHKLPQPSVKSMLARHPFCHDAEIEIFDKNHPSVIAKMMRQLKVKFASTFRDLFMHFCNFLIQFATIVRPFLLVFQPALQQFQLAVQWIEKARSFYLFAIRSREKILQSNINANRVTLRNGVRDADIHLHSNRNVPSRSLSDNPSSFQLESVRDRAMQVDADMTQFGQLDLIPSNGIAVDLREQNRFELPKFLNLGKPCPRCFMAAKAASTLPMTS